MEKNTDLQQKLIISSFSSKHGNFIQFRHVLLIHYNLIPSSAVFLFKMPCENCHSFVAIRTKSSEKALRRSYDVCAKFSS